MTAISLNPDSSSNSKTFRWQLLWKRRNTGAVT